MDDPVKKVEAFITSENCFAVMGQLRRLGVLTKADIEKAMGMTRQDWITYMKEKAGIGDTAPTAEFQHSEEIE